MRLSFFGAAGNVTGSCFLLETTKTKLLVDCGFFQGERANEAKNDDPFPFPPAEITAVILTHAHLDHCGRIPRLYLEKFHGKIYATAPTIDLAEYILLDAAEIEERRSERQHRPSMYRPRDVHALMRNFKPINYHETVKIHDDVSFHLIDAGHILGSASVVVQAEGKTIIFSGDIGNFPAPIIQPTEFPAAADVVVMECTYGDRLHHRRGDRREILKHAFEQTIRNRGILLIPAFAMERTQELLHEIDHFVEHQGMEAIPVFLDSPLAIELTAVFAAHADYYADKERSHYAHDSFYEFPNFQMTETTKDARIIEETPPPKVIIAGSGMMHGGRILGHAQHYLPDPRTTLLIVGYQAENSLGRRLLDGEKRVKIYGQEVEVHAHIEEIDAYSAHADYNQLLDWFGHIKQTPEKIFLTHGEKPAAAAFAEKVSGRFKVKPMIPSEGSSWEI